MPFRYNPVTWKMEFDPTERVTPPSPPSPPSPPADRQSPEAVQAMQGLTKSILAGDQGAAEAVKKAADAGNVHAQAVIQSVAREVGGTAPEFTTPQEQAPTATEHQAALQRKTEEFGPAWALLAQPLEDLSRNIERGTSATLGAVSRKLLKGSLEQRRAEPLSPLTLREAAAVPVVALRGTLDLAASFPNVPFAITESLTRVLSGRSQNPGLELLQAIPGASSAATMISVGHTEGAEALGDFIDEHPSILAGIALDFMVGKHVGKRVVDKIGTPVPDLRALELEPGVRGEPFFGPQDFRAREHPPILPPPRGGGPSTPRSFSGPSAPPPVPGFVFTDPVLGEIRGPELKRGTPAPIPPPLLDRMRLAVTMESAWNALADKRAEHAARVQHARDIGWDESSAGDVLDLVPPPPGESVLRMPTGETVAQWKARQDSLRLVDPERALPADAPDNYSRVRGEGFDTLRTAPPTLAGTPPPRTLPGPSARGFIESAAGRGQLALAPGRLLGEPPNRLLLSPEPPIAPVEEAPSSTPTPTRRTARPVRVTSSPALPADATMEEFLAHARPVLIRPEGQVIVGKLAEGHKLLGKYMARALNAEMGEPGGVAAEIEFMKHIKENQGTATGFADPSGKTYITVADLDRAMAEGLTGQEALDKYGHATKPRGGGSVTLGSGAGEIGQEFYERVKSRMLRGEWPVRAIRVGERIFRGTTPTNQDTSYSETHGDLLRENKLLGNYQAGYIYAKDPDSKFIPKHNYFDASEQQPYGGDPVVLGANFGDIGTMLNKLFPRKKEFAAEVLKLVSKWTKAGEFELGENGKLVYYGFHGTDRGGVARTGELSAQGEFGGMQYQEGSEPSHPGHIIPFEAHTGSLRASEDIRGAQVGNKKQYDPTETDVARRRAFRFFPVRVEMSHFNGSPTDPLPDPGSYFWPKSEMASWIPHTTTKVSSIPLERPTDAYIYRNTAEDKGSISVAVANPKAVSTLEDIITPLAAQHGIPAPRVAARAIQHAVLDSVKGRDIEIPAKRLAPLATRDGLVSTVLDAVQKGFTEAADNPHLGMLLGNFDQILKYVGKDPAVRAAISKLRDKFGGKLKEGLIEAGYPARVALMLSKVSDAERRNLSVDIPDEQVLSLADLVLPKPRPAATEVRRGVEVPAEPITSDAKKGRIKKDYPIGEPATAALMTRRQYSTLTHDQRVTHIRVAYSAAKTVDDFKKIINKFDPIELGADLHAELLDVMRAKLRGSDDAAFAAKVERIAKSRPHLPLPIALSITAEDLARMTPEGAAAALDGVMAAATERGTGFNRPEKLSVWQMPRVAWDAAAAMVHQWTSPEVSIGDRASIGDVLDFKRRAESGVKTPFMLLDTGVDGKHGMRGYERTMMSLDNFYATWKKALKAAGKQAAGLDGIAFDGLNDPGAVPPKVLAANPALFETIVGTRAFLDDLIRQAEPVVRRRFDREIALAQAEIERHSVGPHPSRNKVGQYRKVKAGLEARLKYLNLHRSNYIAWVREAVYDDLKADGGAWAGFTAEVANPHIEHRRSLTPATRSFTNSMRINVPYMLKMIHLEDAFGEIQNRIDTLPPDQAQFVTGLINRIKGVPDPLDKMMVSTMRALHAQFPETIPSPRSNAPVTQAASAMATHLYRSMLHLVSSSLTNMTQLPIFGLPEAIGNEPAYITRKLFGKDVVGISDLEKSTVGAGRIIGDTIVAGYETAKDVATRAKRKLSGRGGPVDTGSGSDADLAAATLQAIERLRQSGANPTLIEQAEVFGEITRHMRDEALTIAESIGGRSMVKKMIRWVNTLNSASLVGMHVTEYTNRAPLVELGMRQAARAGITDKATQLEYAKFLTDRTQGRFGKLGEPPVLQGPLARALKPLYSFPRKAAEWVFLDNLAPLIKHGNIFRAAGAPQRVKLIMWAMAASGISETGKLLKLWNKTPWDIMWGAVTISGMPAYLNFVVDVMKMIKGDEQAKANVHHFLTNMAPGGRNAYEPMPSLGGHSLYGAAGAGAAGAVAAGVDALRSPSAPAAPPPTPTAGPRGASLPPAPNPRPSGGYFGRPTPAPSSAGTPLPTQFLTEEQRRALQDLQNR